MGARKLLVILCILDQCLDKKNTFLNDIFYSMENQQL